VVIDKLLFIFSYPPIEYVDQAIDCRVHVFFGVISVNRTTIYLYGRFSFVPEFLDSKNTVYVRHKIEMALDLFNFGFDVTPQGFGYLDVMA
jgi:hypothetical protein